MPHVTVTLKHTPKPEDVPVVANVVVSPTLYAEGGEVCGLDSVPAGNLTPDEALALARALTLVVGCADDRWRGWHWEAREANGNLLAVTPPGEWYANVCDAIMAVDTLFGEHTRVEWEGRDGIPAGTLLRLPVPPANPEADPDAAWWCKRCDSENAFEICWFCKELKPTAEGTPEAGQ